MAELGAWDVLAASNGFAVPDGFPEGMNYSDVNNAAREIMAVLAREYKDRSGELVSTGSANAYSITSNRTLGAYANGQTFKFRANFASSGAATLNVSSLGTKSICQPSGAAIISGAIQSGSIVECLYSSVLDKFVLFGGFGVDISQVSAASTTAAGKIELATDAEVIAGTDALRAITPASLLASNTALSQRLMASDGYQKFPGGLIIQWGRTGNLGDIPSGIQSSTDTFATAFVTAPHIVSVFPVSLSGGPGEANVRVYWDQAATTNTAAGFKYSEAGSGAQANWAIGYIAIGI
jgi:hypothetical protein